MYSMLVLYVCTVSQDDNIPRRKKRERERERKKSGVSCCFFWKWRLGLGGKDEGTVDKIVSHTFFGGGGRDLFLTYQPKEKPFVHSFVRSVYSQIL